MPDPVALTLPRAQLEVFSGWTGFKASPDSRIVYVSATGSNSNSGLSEDSPKLTIGAAKALIRHGYPDWLLLKRGDTFTEAIGQWKTGGRSTKERQLIGAYGTGARPLVRSGTSTCIFTNLGGNSPQQIDHVALVGLELFAHTATGAQLINGVQWLARSDDLLIEDCLIRGYYTNVVVQGAANARHSNFKLRRSIIADAFTTTTAHAQGLYVSFTDGAIVEECLFDRNGWDTGVVGSVGTIFRHNGYIQSDNTGVVFRRNIVNGTDGVQVRPGGTATDNLITKCAIGLLARGNADGGSAAPIDVRRNVILDGANITDGVPELLRGWGINVEEVSNGTVSQNLIANNVDGDDPRPLIINGNIEGGIANLLVSSNVIANWGGPVRILGNRGTLTNLTFSGNDVKDAGSVYLIQHTGGHALIASNNRFSSAAAAGEWFKVSDVNTSLTAWKALYGDTTSLSSAIAYPDATRSTATYSTLVGGAGTHADFIAKCRAQSKEAWNDAYTADAVNDYIRAGFGMSVG